MAITFPITDLFAKGNVKTTSFRSVDRQAYSRTAAGALKAYDFGLPIWAASFVTATMGLDDCVEFEALLQRLEGAVGTFTAMDTRRNMPRLYPSGSFPDTAVVDTLGGDGKSLSISGLPPFFTISVGDYFSITVSGVPLLYRAAERSTADATGVAGLFGALPHYDPAITAGAAVKFKNPTCLMRLEPGSVQFNDGANALGTISFSAMQV